ncbi:MAG: DNA methyltransferase [Candidatus Bathyarchaeia archaeon]
MNSYILKDFPIERLNQIALKEANAKKPIYQIHKWWARRLGSIFRMIILATFLPDNISENELWRRFYQKTDLGGKIILDPFMGGGTTVVEALKLGCKVIGVDIHPVAWFITKKEVEPLDLNKFKEEFKRLEKRVADKIKSYYKTICPKCGEQADVMYVFWVKKIKCLKCGESVPLFSSFRIASPKGKLHVVFCPNCKEIIETEKLSEEITCPNCEKAFTPSQGYARGKHYLCPSCGSKGEILRAVKREGKIPETEMYAIEYYCPKCDERGYKRAERYDHELYLKAKNEFEKNKDKLLFPRQKIPEGEKTREPLNYNYQYFYQMFNERQLLCLSTLLEEILKIEDENIREFMILTFSDCVNSNNMFCKYNALYRKIEPLFGHHAYWPPNMPIENNVWGTNYGRGTFISYVNKTVRAKKYMLYPYEIMPEGGNLNKVIVGNDIKGRLSNDFSEISKDGANTILKAQTSEDLLFIPNKSVDAVITDPPYYDNVMYSEISDFFYIWQRLALKETYECYEGEYSPRSREIIKNLVQNKDDNFFLKGLTNVFKECNRVLKDNGIMAFTFHHERSEAWASTLRAILDAREEGWPRFVISAIYPVRSEARVGVHGEGIRYDIVIVCRKTFEEPERVSWEVLKDRIHDRAREVLERLWLSDRDLRDEDMFVIAMGKCLELYSKHYPEIYKDGRRVTVEEAVSSIDDIIDSLLKIKDIEALPGAIDEITRIYCSYIAGLDKIDYDALHKRLSKGGIEIDTFIKENLIVKEKSMVRILTPQERRQFIEEKIKRGKDLLTIDRVHLIYSIYKEGKPLIKYLSGYGGEEVKKAAELIYRKTGDEAYAKIAGIATTIPKKVKPLTLEDFIGESQ